MPRPASSWAVDTLGMKGVIWQQSYLGRRSPGFHRGKARENWNYIVRDEAVLLDAAGEPVIVSNMGDDWVEIGAGWQAMEDASTRANAKIQSLAIAPFDSDVSEAEMIATLRHFCTTVLDPLDLPYSAAIHAPPEHGDSRNFHPHISFALRPMRRIEPYCWDIADDVCGELDGRDGVQMLRHLWAHSMSMAAEEARSNRRYTGLGYGTRRLDLEPGEHLGEARAAMVARGQYAWVHQRNRIKAERNAARRAIRDADHKIAALTTIRDAALERMKQRVVGVAAAKVMRSAPLADVSAVFKPVDVAVPATMLAGSKAERPAVSVDAASIGTPSRAVLMVSVGPANVRILGPVGEVDPPVLGAIATKPVPSAKAFTESGAITPAVRFRAPRSAAAPVRHRAATAPAVPGHLQSVGPVRPPAAPLRTTDLSIGARTMAAVRSVRPPRILTARSTAAASPHVDPTTALLDALGLAQAARRRRQRRAVGSDTVRLDTLPTLEALPSLDTLPAVDRTAAGASSIASTETPGFTDIQRIAQLRTIDPYVADIGGEDSHAEIDYRALRAIGVGWDWLTAPGIQPALRSMRNEQQQVIAALTADVVTRPLAFARTGFRFWPRDLPEPQLRRLDRWASDPGFQHDVFAIQRMIDKAHAARDAERRRQDHVAERAQAAASVPVPDGFGGGRQGPAPVFNDTMIRTHIAPFDPKTGIPSDQLLLLLMLVGRHPRQVEFANDGRLMARPGKPVLLASLLHPWRHDERVAGLVAETVRASRDAGIPVWPKSIVKAVEAYVVRIGTATSAIVRRPPPDHDRGPAR